MKIYINSQKQIRAVQSNGNDTSLTEITVDDDFLEGLSDAVKCGYCYDAGTDENGNPYVAVYPYKDLAMLEAIQQQYEAYSAETEMLRRENKALRDENAELMVAVSNIIGGETNVE